MATTLASPPTAWGPPTPACCCSVSPHTEVHVHGAHGVHGARVGARTSQFAEKEGRENTWRFFPCLRFLSPLRPPFSPFPFFSTPLKLRFPILLSLSLSLFLSHSLSLSPCISRPNAFPYAHTHTRALLFRYPRSCHFSPCTIHIKRPQ